MISIVCVYNDKDILDNYLIRSLKDQTVVYELILINNTNGKFRSAAEALNYGGQKARGKYIMFVHQDVDLSSNTWLEDVEKILKSLDKLGVAGVAGKSENRKGVITNIKHGSDHRLVGKIQIKEPIKVQTVDECLFIVPKSLFQKISFDENVCDDWHLYAVEYCLNTRKLGYNIYVIPVYVYHKSGGSFSKKYYKVLNKVIKKHGKYYKTIHTTMGDWDTRHFIILKFEIICFWRQIKSLLRKLIS